MMRIGEPMNQSNTVYHNQPLVVREAAGTAVAKVNTVHGDSPLIIGSFARASFPVLRLSAIVDDKKI